MATVTLADIVVRSVHTDTLAQAYEAAAQACRIRSRGGWVTLAMVQGTKQYKVSIRPVQTRRGYQFGCSCPHWCCRLNADTSNHQLCKHQSAFLQEAFRAPRNVTFTIAGLAFVKAVACDLGLPEETPIFSAVAKVA